MAKAVSESRITELLPVLEQAKEPHKCPAANDMLIVSTDRFPLLSAQPVPTCLLSISQKPQTRKIAKQT